MNEKSQRNFFEVALLSSHPPAAVRSSRHRGATPYRWTATPEAAIGEAHRGAPEAVAVDGISRVEIGASWSRAHAPWLTATYVRLQVGGRDHDFMSVSGDGVPTTGQAAEIGRLLADLDAMARAADAAQTQAYPHVLGAEVAP